MTIRMSSGLKNEVLYSKPLISALSFGVIHIYSGPQPSSANDAPTGTLLASVTRGGASWIEGSSEGGLVLLAQPSYSYLIKHPDHSWVMTVENAGSAGWWRFRSNSDSTINLDGSITAPYKELYIGEPALSQGETRNINAFQIGFYW